MKVRVPWNADATGELRGVAVHDGALLDFHASQGRQVYLIKSQTSEIIEVQLLGVLDFNVVKFWHGAIVSGMFAWKLSEVPAQLWELADGAWNTLFDGRASSQQAKRTARRWTQALPEAYLFQMLCTYGGLLLRRVAKSPFISILHRGYNAERLAGCGCGGISSQNWSFSRVT